MRQFASFRKNTKGSVSYIVVMSLIPLLGSVGLAVDYSRASQAKAVLQGALDSTALMLAKEAAKKTEAQLQAMGETYFAALMGKEPEIARGALSVKKSDKTVTLATSGNVVTHFAHMFSWSNWDIAVKAASAYGSKKMEIALVLDNTGSMQSSNKIGELKKATHALLNILEQAANTPDQIKIAMVPYTTRVNLGTAYKNENWLTNTPTGSFISDYVRPANRNAWQGCVADREAPYNRNGAATNISNAASLYPMVNCTDGVAESQLLTSNFNTLRARTNAMHANGMTNITLGAQWGYEMLTNNAPFSEASTGSDVERFMILLTDGQNTQDRFGVWDENRMNGDTQAMCDTIVERGVPDASKKMKIKLYTILVIDGNPTLLRNCASDPSMFFKVNQASQLESVFKKIADDIGTIRLTM